MDNAELSVYWFRFPQMTKLAQLHPQSQPMLLCGHHHRVAARPSGSILLVGFYGKIAAQLGRDWSVRAATKLF